MTVNYFQDLHDKGIIEIELSPKELQDLFIAGRITQNQFIKVLKDNVGMKRLLEILHETFDKSYLKDLKEDPEIKDFIKSWDEM